MAHLPDDAPLLLTIQKAAARLGVTPNALTSTARRSGYLIKVGNRFYVKSTELEAIIESARVPPVVTPQSRTILASDISSNDKLIEEKVRRVYETAEWLRTMGKRKKQKPDMS